MENTAENPTFKFQLRPDVVMECFDDGALILRLSDRHLIEVNPVGQHILNLTDGGRNAAEVAGALADHFEISTAEALEDTLAFYADLQAQGVVEIKPPASSVEREDMPETTTTTTPYLRNPDVVLREEDEDGGLLFNPDTNQVKVVNPTGLFIWQQCDGTHSFEQIVAAIVEAFEDAPAEEVRKDVQEYLDGMIQTGFVGLVE